jgi:hypothetical protein
MKLKNLMLIAGALAAEQRTAVAHSASYGSGHPQYSQAPAGATEKQRSITDVFRPVRGLIVLQTSFPRFYRGLLSSATPWLMQTNLLRNFDLWHTPSLIC